MDREIHNLYDVILKIIAVVYGTIFLNYIGIEGEIKEILNVEFTTLTGSKLYLDFLCRMSDDTLRHIEFQYPRAGPEDAPRFFRYNIVAEARYLVSVETTVFNFTSGSGNKKIHDIRESKSFHPPQFNLGDVDFEEYMDNINIKVKSNTQLTHFEEITLLLMALNYDFTISGQYLRMYQSLLKIGNYLMKASLNSFRWLWNEISNLLSEDEQKEIKGESEMTPKAMAVVTQAINEVNQKVLAETREDAFNEGRAKTLKQVAKNLRDKIDLDVLSKATGLTVDEIKKL